VVRNKLALLPTLSTFEGIHRRVWSSKQAEPWRSSQGGGKR